MPTASSHLFTLQIRQIPTWSVALPALQRGFVWRPAQMEALWDSLMRGFPVGSLLVAPYRKKLGSSNLALNVQQSSPLPQDIQYHLLDGQQRCTSMGAAFLDPWSPTRDDQPAEAVLWLDLLAPASAKDARKFVFRVLTRAHPWGYQLQDPTRRMAAYQKRAALEAFRAATPDDAKDRWHQGRTELRYAWPWDARCPVPFCLLLQAHATATREGMPLLAALITLCAQHLPFWMHDRFNAQREMLLSPPDALPARLATIGAALDRLTGDDASYVIPVQVIDAGGIPESSPDSAEQMDPIETLFIRVNAGGTRLEGEELIYSILKSIWPESEALVDSLSSSLMSPSRLVMLFSRLIIGSEEKTSPFPAAPGVDQFRRLIHGLDGRCSKFEKRLHGMLETDPRGAAHLLGQARRLLGTPPDTTGAGDFQLPPVLVAQLARQSTPVLLLLLRWIQRMNQARHDPEQLGPEDHRRIIGTLTAIGWFSAEKERCTAVLWEELGRTEDEALPAFFGPGRLTSCLCIQDNRLLIAPPLSPDILEKATRTRLGSLMQEDGTGAAWESWSWYTHYSVAPAINESDPDGLLIELRAMARASANDGSGQADDLALRGWPALVEALWDRRELVLYAQRRWLEKWFPDFDPARPDQTEDTDRPWDMDHLHAQSYVSNIHGGGKRIGILGEWSGTIGNLRAWPLDLNRGDQDGAPCQKLQVPPDPDLAARLRGYHIQDIADLSQASALPEGSLLQWHATTPTEKGFAKNYLKNMPEYSPRLLQAITERLFHLYRHWYTELRIGELTTRA